MNTKEKSGIEREKEKKANIFARFFLPRYMVKDEHKLADDFGTRSCYAAFVKFAWPAVLESVLIGLMNFVDSLMVSTVGEEAIAAVGLTNNPRLIFYAVFLAISVATNAIVARRRGEGDRDGANRCLTTVLPVTVLLAVAFFAVSYAVTNPFLIFAGAKEDTIDYAVVYFRITMFGMIFTSISLIINSAQRASGNTRIAMTTSMCANAVNILFNALLINGYLGFPQLGVKGAAIATAMGNIVSAVVSVMSLYRKNKYLHLRVRDLFRPSRQYLALTARIGLGASVEQIFLRIGFFTFAKLVAELGTDDFSAHQIGMTIINLSFTLGDGLGVAASAMVGQNLGKKRPDRSAMFGKLGQRIGLCAGLMFVLIFAIFGRTIICWFTDEPYIIGKCQGIMYMIMALMPAQVSQVIFGGCLRGAGDTKYTAVVSFIAITVCRPVLTYFLVYTVGMGLYGAWVAVLIDQYIRMILCGVRFYSYKWMKIKI